MWWLATSRSARDIWVCMRASWQKSTRSSNSCFSNRMQRRSQRRTCRVCTIKIKQNPHIYFPCVRIGAFSEFSPRWNFISRNWFKVCGITKSQQGVWGSRSVCPKISSTIKHWSCCFSNCVCPSTGYRNHLITYMKKMISTAPYWNLPRER